MDEQANKTPETGGATAATMAQAQAATPKGKTPKKAKPVKASKAKAKPVKKAKAKSGEVQGLMNKKQRPGYVAQYRKGKKDEKTAGGNTPIDCNDKVAIAFRGRDLDYCYKETARALAPDETVASLKAKYGKLNVGMQRMNLGNRLRGALNAK